MTADVAVIGIGNGFRRDDGVAPAAAAAVEARAIPEVSVLIDAGDPAVVLDAWAGVRLACGRRPARYAIDTQPYPPLYQGPTRRVGRYELARRGHRQAAVTGEGASPVA